LLALPALSLIYRPFTVGISALLIVICASAAVVQATMDSMSIFVFMVGLLHHVKVIILING
jgi:hypothetical protein